MFKFVSRGARLVVGGVGGLQRSIRPASKLGLTNDPLVASRFDVFTRGYVSPLIVGRHHHYGGLLMQKCNCGCGSSRSAHTKGDKELAEFLTEEIVAEQKAQTSPKLTKIEGFDVVTDGAAITFTRTSGKQNIKVTVNVNHSVDADVPDEEVNPNQDKVNLNEMRSKPSFTVEVEQGGRTMSFGCTIVNEVVSPEEQADPEAYNDVFNIEEVSVYDGQRAETTYAVSGEIMDGYLYDLLMNFLEERGISNDFAEKLVDYCTTYEHKLYVGLLENIKAFVGK